MKSMIRAAALTLLLPAILSGCAGTEPAMLLNADLGGAPAMQVQGRQGWQVKQLITFGEFTTGPVKRSWTKGYDYPFIIRFTGAREKLAFDTVDHDGRRVEVFCAGKLSEQDFHKFERYFDINLRTRDIFSGTVVTPERQSVDFFVHHLNQNSTSGEVEGAVRGAGMDISIRPVWRLSSGQKSWDTRPLGLEFVEGTKVLGAVETVNDGRVWLDGSLNTEQRLVLAGVASALLLRSDLADHND